MSTPPRTAALPVLASVPLAAPSGLLGAAGWVVALVALTAALVLRRVHNQRLALVAEAAHELRGPLCAARLGLHALESAGDPVARRAAAVELELRRAGLALEDFAAAPKGRRTSDRRELVDAGGLLAGAALGWSAVARAHGARLRVEAPRAPALVRGDRLRLVQALGNLVANAAEHGGGEVLVRCVVARGAVRLEICDEGPGLPASVSQLAGGGYSCGARGHGLAIAARIAARHGGHLASAPSARGARLVLELPLAHPQPPPIVWLRHAVAGRGEPDGALASLGDGPQHAGSAGPLGPGSAGRLGADSGGRLDARPAGPLADPAASGLRAGHSRSASPR